MSDLTPENVLQKSTIIWDTYISPDKTVLKKDHILEIEQAIATIEQGLTKHMTSTSSAISHTQGSATGAGMLSKGNVTTLNNIANLISQIEALIPTYSPKGIITAYDKEISQIKAGYTWCNGSSETVPDTRGKIIIGMSGKEPQYQEYEIFKDGQSSDIVDGTRITQYTVKAVFQQKL